jgi:RNA polymerase sigma-70 factor (sigma-E family)
VDEPVDGEFRQFVAARWSALTRYAYFLTGDHQTAEDVVQVALEKCWHRWAKIEAGSPEAYVRAAIANAAASRHRRKRHRESPLDALSRSSEPSSADHASAHALRSDLWRALAELSPRRRTIVVLRICEDRSEAETARILGISTGAVKSQLSKAMAHLRVDPSVRDAAGLGPEPRPRTMTGEGAR